MLLADSSAMSGLWLGLRLVGVDVVSVGIGGTRVSSSSLSSLTLGASSGESSFAPSWAFAASALRLWASSVGILLLVWEGE